MIIQWINDIVGILPVYSGSGSSYNFNAEMYRYICACAILIVGVVVSFKLVFSILRMLFKGRY